MCPILLLWKESVEDRGEEMKRRRDQKRRNGHHRVIGNSNMHVGKNYKGIRKGK